MYMYILLTNIKCRYEHKLPIKYLGYLHRKLRILDRILYVVVLGFAYIHSFKVNTQLGEDLEALTAIYGQMYVLRKINRNNLQYSK